jgi:hypothetical protein
VVSQRRCFIQVHYATRTDVWAGTAQSVQNGRYRVLTPVGARFSVPVQIGPGVLQPHVKWVPAFFPRVKRPGSGVDHTLHLTQKLNKQQSYASTPLLGIHALFWGKSNLYFYDKNVARQAKHKVQYNNMVLQALLYVTLLHSLFWTVSVDLIMDFGSYSKKTIYFRQRH